MWRHRIHVVAAVAVLAFSWASRGSAQEKAVFIDLAPHMNFKLTDNLSSGREGNNLSALPTGEQTLGEIRFQVGPGLVQLASNVLTTMPEKVDGIAVDRTIGKLHILHGTSYGGGLNKPGDDWYVMDGTLIGQYVVHYEDGSSEGIPITYGEDVRDWWYVEGEAEPSKGKVVWKGENAAAAQFGAHLRLYASTWNNPKPDKKVKSIDYVSRKNDTPAAPFCLSMTVEDK